MATLIFFSSISVHSTLTFGVRHFCPVQIFSKLLTVVITEPLLRVQVFWHVTPCVLSQSHCWGFTSFGTWRRVFYHRAIVEGSGLLARDAVCFITEPLLRVHVFCHVTPCVLSQSHCWGFTSLARDAVCVITESLLKVQVFWHVTPCVLLQSHCWGFRSFGTWSRVCYHRAIAEGSGLLARDAVYVITVIAESSGLLAREVVYFPTFRKEHGLSARVKQSVYLLDCFYPLMAMAQFHCWHATWQSVAL